MIRQVIIRRFKQFDDVVFNLPGHIVLAGPNNMGKTTMLQAIAAWSLAFNKWKQRNDFNPRKNGYVKATIMRSDFSAVPLRSFELLWNKRNYRGTIEIEIAHTEGWRVTMELSTDTDDQIYVRPKADAIITPDILRSLHLETVYVPPMTGLSTDEPVYTRPRQDKLLGQGKPGEIIRNLLVDAHNSSEAWPALQSAMERLFQVRLSPPNDQGAEIIAEYEPLAGGPRFDIASAGSGFQQVLMLLTFLHSRPASVLLLDEPDAHLYVILQDVIYSELRSVAAHRNSQLIVATHSEVIINSVEPRELCMLMGGQPRLLVSVSEREKLARSLSLLTNADIMQALKAPGILYVEGHTDIDILREWAKVLKHPVQETLTSLLFWKPTVWEMRLDGGGIKSEDHYKAIQLVRNDVPALILLDGDNKYNIPDTPITGKGLQRMRWRRYEIESYLFHPVALERYVIEKVGIAAAPTHVSDLRQYLQDNLPPAVFANPLGDHPYLNSVKARKDLLPPALAAAGLPEIAYTEYSDIAALMLPEEIHPEVIEKLDAIQQAFGLQTAATAEEGDNHE